MNIADYPQLIADAQRSILKLDQQLRMHRESVAFSLNAIERAIAHDPTLKNDSQRKAKKTELMETDDSYIQASYGLKKCEDLRTQMDIDLQLLRSQFSILKLEKREAIATMELHASAAA